MRQRRSGSMRSVRLITVVVLAGLGGCSVLPEPPAPPAQYSLEIAPRPFRSAPDGPVLVVGGGAAAVGYGTTAMRFTRGASRLLAYPDGEWVAPPQNMVVEAAIEALGASGRYRAVLTDTEAVHADLRLTLQLKTLLHDRSGDGSLRLRLRAVLVDRTGDVTLADVISARVEAEGSGADVMATASRRALAQVVSELVDRMSARPAAPMR